MLAALAAVIIADYYVTAPRLRGRRGAGAVNWSGVLALVVAVGAAHFVLRRWMPIEVLSAVACVCLFYPLLRLQLLRPAMEAPR